MMNHRVRAYGLMLVMVLLGLMVIHNLRQRSLFNLLLQQKDTDLISLQLVFQKERELTKEIKRWNEDLKAKVYLYRNQKKELSGRVLEMQSTIASLRGEQKAMESALEEKQTEIKILKRTQAELKTENGLIVSLTESLRQREVEIHDLRHNCEYPPRSKPSLDLSTVVNNVSGNRPNETSSSSVKEGENIMTRGEAENESKMVLVENTAATQVKIPYNDTSTNELETTMKLNKDEKHLVTGATGNRHQEGGIKFKAAGGGISEMRVKHGLFRKTKGKRISRLLESNVDAQDGYKASFISRNGRQSALVMKGRESLDSSSANPAIEKLSLDRAAQEQGKDASIIQESIHSSVFENSQAQQIENTDTQPDLYADDNEEILQNSASTSGESNEDLNQESDDPKFM